MAAGPSSFTLFYLSQIKIGIVMDQPDLARGDSVCFGQSGNGPAGFIHEGEGFHQENLLIAESSSADQGFPLMGEPGKAVFLAESIDNGKPQVVRSVLEPAPGISQADNDDHGLIIALLDNRGNFYYNWNSQITLNFK